MDWYDSSLDKLLNDSSYEKFRNASSADYGNDHGGSQQELPYEIPQLPTRKRLADSLLCPWLHREVISLQFGRKTFNNQSFSCDLCGWYTDQHGISVYGCKDTTNADHT